MSTVAEIEKAIAALPEHDRAELLRHLSAGLAHSPRTGWPVPPPDVPREELERIEAEIEAAFPSLRG